MRTVLMVAVFCGLVLSACVQPPPPPTPPTKFSNPSATREQFMADRYECIKESQQTVSGAVVNQAGGAASTHAVISCGILNSCLGAKKYVVDPSGPLFAPPGMAIHCMN
jgi:hypothetical protein